MERSLTIFFVFLFSTNLVKAETCTVAATGQSGECKFMSECPAVQSEYQRTRVMPTICDARYRTVCCPTQARLVQQVTTTKAPGRVSERKCREFGQNIYENYTVPNSVFGEPPITRTRNVCGHDQTVELIVGGLEAGEREFPHMCLIGYNNGAPDDYQCGGSLISDIWILSAAHCSNTIHGPAKFAKLGSVVRNRDNLNTWTYNIIQRINHPSYNSRHAEDDIALFKLESSVKFNSYVIPICLPQTGAQTTKRVIASGWGRTGFADDASEKLMKVTIEYFDQSRCNDVYEDDEKLNEKGINWPKMICAGSTNKTGDTCGGDSGGPIQIFTPNVDCMYTIVGVTSFGSVYCGAVGIPAIYTKVYYYLDWIESNVWPSL